MHLDLTEPETDYVYRLLLARPMGEVEPLVNKLRAQVAAATAVTKEETPASVKPNGGFDDNDLPALP